MSGWSVIADTGHNMQAAEVWMNLIHRDTGLGQIPVSMVMGSIAPKSISEAFTQDNQANIMHLMSLQRTIHNHTRTSGCWDIWVWMKLNDTADTTSVKTKPSVISVGPRLWRGGHSLISHKYLLLFPCSIHAGDHYVIAYIQHQHITDTVTCCSSNKSGKIPVLSLKSTYCTVTDSVTGGCCCGWSRSTEDVNNLIILGKRLTVFISIC